MAVAVGNSLAAASTLFSPVLLHLRLEEVAPSTHEVVASDQLPLDAVGEVGVTGRTERLDRFAEGEVGGPR